MEYLEPDSGWPLVGLSAGPIVAKVLESHRGLIDYVEMPFEQLRHHPPSADLQEKIESLKQELHQILAVEVAPPTPAIEAPEPPKKGRKQFSAKTRAKMAAAQQARWAAKRGEVGAEAAPTAKPDKKKVSDARLKALAKAREARWAKVRAAKKVIR